MQIVLPVRKTHRMYALYECVVGTASGGEEVIYVGVERLTRVFNLLQPNSNSEWNKLFSDGDGQVLVHILAINADQHVLRKQAGDHMRAMQAMPRCNLRGVRSMGQSRPVWCSVEGGKVYRSQNQASLELGIAQSAISRCVNGQAVSTHGLIFREATPADVAAVKEKV